MITIFLYIQSFSVPILCQCHYVSVVVANSFPLGFLLCDILVSRNSSAAHARAAVHQLFLLEAGLLLLCLASVYYHFPDKPATPPSKAAVERTKLRDAGSNDMHAGFMVLLACNKQETVAGEGALLRRRFWAVALATTLPKTNLAYHFNNTSFQSTFARLFIILTFESALAYLFVT